MFGQKGQEAAPFELLVAVVIMGFVLLAGVNVMDILRKEQCKGDLDSQLEAIKGAIESVASGEGQKDFSFTLPSCYSRNVNETIESQKTKLFVLNRQDRNFCSQHCSGGKVECMVLWFHSLEENNVKCLSNVSTVTNFPTCPQNDPDQPYDPNICSPCNDRFSGLTVQAMDLKTEIEDGQYILVKKFFLSSSSADICAYKKGVR